jgi:hypothetical protein
MFGNPDHFIYCEKTWKGITSVVPKFGKDVAAIMRNFRAADWSLPEQEGIDLAKEDGVVGEPWVFLIDKQGVVRQIFKGFTVQSTLEAKIAELVAGKQP